MTQEPTSDNQDREEHTTNENVVPLFAPRSADMSKQDKAALDREFVWDEKQELAIQRGCDMQERIVPITGPAGTGKTTLIREIYKKLTRAGYAVVLCAPTGKAAKRIQEATGIAAMTIHRLLEYPHPGERDAETGAALLSTDPKRCKSNPIHYQVVLCDEYAMVNKEVHSNLIFALPRGGRLVMFGDVNQLTPIEKHDRTGKESPFQAALRKFDKVAVHLDRIHRTTEGSGIAENGMRILKGRIPSQRPDFTLNITEQPVRELEEHVITWLEKGVNYGTNQAQIICTQNKSSWVGAYKLNLALQRLLMPMSVKDRIKLARHRWEEKLPVHVGVGDKVIWTENCYDMRNVFDRYVEDDYGNAVYISPPPEKVCMNGETGIITLIEENEMHIDLGDRVIEVPKKQTIELKNGNLAEIDLWRTISLAYAITTHKAQGSEWGHVTYVINRTASMLLSRHNLYTAVTRAREHATIIADQAALQTSLRSVESALDRKKRMGM